MSVAAVSPAAGEDCADADPSGVTAEVYGDFEFTVDPNDPAQHMIYLNHVTKGPSNIAVAQMDGVTAQILPGTLTTIARNFQGRQKVNGPEFFMPPGRGLGALYRALDGVHGIFRPFSPKVWNDFSLDVYGAPTGKNPPALRSTDKTSYEAGDLPLAQNTYTLLDGPCALRCFASVLRGEPTDAARAFRRQQDLTIPSIESVVQSERDYVIYAEACTRDAKLNGVCGLYEARINQRGGFEKSSLNLLVTLPQHVGPLPERVPLIAGVHPATGSTVFFVEGFHESGSSVDVYERQTVGGPLALIGSVPAEKSDHYRIITSPTQMVMHYLVRHGSLAGSYEIPVTASGGKLRVGLPQMIASTANGAEVEYLPAAGKFTIFYRTSARPSRIERCFFQP